MSDWFILCLERKAGKSQKKNGCKLILYLLLCLYKKKSWNDLGERSMSSVSVCVAEFSARVTEILEHIE
jgi:hypothetical protein